MSTSGLTEKQILDAPESDYMSPEQLEFFKGKLLDLHASTRTRIMEVKQQMEGPVGCSDENDRASYEEQSNIALRIVTREQKLLPKIQQALERIRQGEYGYCLESGDPIGIPRLLARLTAEFCTEIKAMKEIKEYHFNKE